MTLAFAVVGPGRVGTALATLWVRAGWHCLGFLGGSRSSAERAIALAGEGAVLAHYAELRRAALVLLAPPDARLVEVVLQAAAAGAPRPCSLWLHASGRYDMTPLQPLRGLGARLGSLHPACPVLDAESGVRDLPGKPAVVAGDPRSRRLLLVAAAKAGMRGFWLELADRALYHAACALAANGLTALADGARTGLVASGADPVAAQAISVALLQAALDAVAARGAEAALTGPVRRGDAQTVADHLDALRQGAPALSPMYLALMGHALTLAQRSGALGQDAARSIAECLGLRGAHGG